MTFSERAVEDGNVVTEAEARKIFDNAIIGTDELKQVFGEGAALVVDKIPFSKKELIEAAEKGAKLIYRMDSLPDGSPMTMQNLDKFADSAMMGDVEGAVEYNMEFFTQEPVERGWAITKAVEIPHTNHLSYEAQAALIAKDEKRLEAALNDIPLFWDKVGIPNEVRPALPTLDDLKLVMERLPEGTELPSAVELFYDVYVQYKLNGQDVLSNVATATRSKAQELSAIDEPERPIDIGLTENGKIHFHWRRDMRFGRPGETKPGSVPGIPINYIQRKG